MIDSSCMYLYVHLTFLSFRVKNVLHLANSRDVLVTCLTLRTIGILVLQIIRHLVLTSYHLYNKLKAVCFCVRFD